MTTPPRRVGLSAVEVVSPELRKALGIERPTNLLDPAQTANRPGGLGAVLFPESTIQSAQARTMMGGSPFSGISPSFSRAVTGSPTGLDQDAQTTLMGLSGMLPEQRPDDLMKQIENQAEVDTFKELDQAKVINDKFAGLEEDVVNIDKSGKKVDADPFVNVGGEDDGSGEDTTTDTTTEVDGADTPAKKATVKALDEFFAEARPGISPKTFDEYINEFGEATGLDVSGEADTKQALMSFGLALMQNRAGKGFDVSKILTSVGEAGEAAMPDFRKAVAEAKAIRAKAGSYALSQKESDQKKAMNRASYVVIPKEGGLQNSILQNTGRFARLNSYELNNLMNNAEFNERFEVIDASTYTDMTKSLITAANKNKKKTFLEKPTSIPLFGGSKIKFDVFYANPNNLTGAKNQIIEPQLALNTIATMEKGLKRAQDQFRDIAALINQTGVTAGDQIQSFGTQLAKSFGIKIGSGKTTPLKRLQAILTELKARNAADILGESGKTISDNDRRLVDEIVGGIDVFKGEGDLDLLKEKLGRLYKNIIDTRRDEINEAYRNVGRFINIQQGGAATGGTKYEKAEDEQGVVYRRIRPSGT
mgnify:CR=1 FL=1|tara:strand:+ start:982 stop:2754 length:1773 start_codon:yes stop_codon:yes gene_type:complete